MKTRLPRMIPVLLLVLATLLSGSCSLFYGNPEVLTNQELAALDLVFPSGMVSYLSGRVFLDDTISQASCYYPGLEMILIRRDFRTASIDSLVLVHEFTHYWQDAMLHREMTVTQNYQDYLIPDDLSTRLNIEAEAELVRSVASTRMEGGTVPADRLEYMDKFLGLSLH